MSSRRPYAHLQGWAIVVSVALGLAALRLALLMEALRADASLQSDRREKVFVAQGDLAADHSRLTLGVKTTILILAVGALLWLIWQFQAHSNLRTLVKTSRFTPPVGAVSWLVPGINLVLPFLAMEELWRRGDPYEEETKRTRRRAFPFLSVWWAFWLTGLAFVVLAYRATPPSAVATPGQLIARDKYLAVASLVGVGAAVLGMILVNKIAGRIGLKEEGMGSPEWRSWTSR